VTDVLVFDLGTSYFKASVFSDTGELRSLEACPIPSTRPSNGRHEIETGTFTDAVTTLARTLDDRLPDGLRNVEAVTFSTQTNSFLLRDAHNNPLTPIIVWDDRRGHVIQDAPTVPSLYETTGVPELSTEFMVAKLLWLQRFKPDLFDRTARIGLISDYLTFWCTGCWVTELGVAGLTGLLDIRERVWWPEALDRFGLQREWMPKPVCAGTDVGTVKGDVAEALHLPKNCRYVVGCLDQYAGAIGVGNVAPGGLSETTGTVLATVRCTDEFTTGGGVFCGPGYAPGVYYQMVFGSISANLLEIYRDALGGHVTFSELDRLASQFSGTASPLELPIEDNVAALCECIKNWAHDRDKGEVTRAILERVAMALFDQVAALSGNSPPETIKCAGGAARSNLWRTIKANMLGIPTVALECPEPTSLGAALLAMGSLSGESIPSLAAAHVKPGAVVHPDPAMYNVYAALRAAHGG
jgi:xylulokinase